MLEVEETIDEGQVLFEFFKIDPVLLNSFIMPTNLGIKTGLFSDWSSHISQKLTRQCYNTALQCRLHKEIERDTQNFALIRYT